MSWKATKATSFPNLTLSAATNEFIIPSHWYIFFFHMASRVILFFKIFHLPHWLSFSVFFLRPWSAQGWVFVFSIYGHVLGVLFRFHCLKFHLLANDFQIHISELATLELQTHWCHCLLSISACMASRDLKVSTFQKWSPGTVMWKYKGLVLGGLQRLVKTVVRAKNSEEWAVWMVKSTCQFLVAWWLVEQGRKDGVNS